MNTQDAGITGKRLALALVICAAGGVFVGTLFGLAQIIGAVDSSVLIKALEVAAQ